MKTKRVTMKSLRRSVMIESSRVWASVECCLNASTLCEATEDEDGMMTLRASGATEEEAVRALHKRMEDGGWRDYETEDETGWACAECVKEYRESERIDRTEARRAARKK